MRDESTETILQSFGNITYGITKDVRQFTINLEFYIQSIKSQEANYLDQVESSYSEKYRRNAGITAEKGRSGGDE